MSTDTKITIPTEEQVVAFFRSNAIDFQNRLPGYVSLRIEVGQHASGEESVEWGAYHNDNGHSPLEHKGSLGRAIKWHFGTEAVARKVAILREEAAEKLRQADALAAQIPTS
jgi:hypothetical protein